MRSYLVWMMAIASGATVANLYYNQPLLAVMAQSFHASAHASGFIPMLTQIGHAVGILLFVPLGDLMERRQLIVTMLGATALALVLAAMSPSMTWLLVASFAIGMAASATQIIIPFAAQLANPLERGGSRYCHERSADWDSSSSNRKWICGSHIGLESNVLACQWGDGCAGNNTF